VAFEEDLASGWWRWWGRGGGGVLGLRRQAREKEGEWEEARCVMGLQGCGAPVLSWGVTAAMEKQIPSLRCGMTARKAKNRFPEGMTE